MVWFLVIVLLVLVFGLGTVLEAALWAMLLLAAIVVIGGLMLGGMFRGGRRGAA